MHSERGKGRHERSNGKREKAREVNSGSESEIGNVARRMKMREIQNGRGGGRGGQTDIQNRSQGRGG